ncbi:MAG: aminotransferase class V-fold PLP-dependent enzyme [Planctomycetes bacterium]|nr:aminotransferase class V-fold PLP-dependent enzyme [Planctomycetota bacterium]
MSDKPIYMDNAATTRLDPEVFAAMEPFFNKHFGNAASKYYQEGRTAHQAMESARGQLAGLLGADDEKEITITSCATESNNWVINSLLLNGTKKHVITSAIEHHAILEPIEFLEKHHGIKATILPVDERGMVSPQLLKDSITDETALVSIMHANNEIGTVLPIRELADIAHEKGVLFHTDACQTVGKIPVKVNELGADFLSLSAHKFHGPKGTGALYIRKGTRLEPFIRGGGQERGRRAGTSNIPSIVGMGKAAELAGKRIESEAPRERELVEKLWQGLNAKMPKIRRNGDPEKRIPNLLNICVAGVEGEAVLGYLDMYGIMVSSGSACTSGSLDPSHVLLAIGLPAEVAHGSIRFSMSHETEASDVERIIEIMPDVVERLRQMSPTWNG